MSSQSNQEGQAVELTYRESIRVALEDSLEEDHDVVLLGEDIAAAGGALQDH